MGYGTGVYSAGFQSTLPIRGATGHFVGSDPKDARFQSTLPIRGATAAAVPAPVSADISIHAPHTRSDDVGAGI